MVRREDRGDRAVTGRAATWLSNPRAVTLRARPNRTMFRVSCQVVSPTRISPGLAASWSRAARFTVAPETRSWSAGPEPVATAPELTPTRTWSWTGSPISSPSLAVRSRITTPALTARSASSSCACGRPNTAMTASPMNFSARPRSDASSVDTIR